MNIPLWSSTDKKIEDVLMNLGDVEWRDLSGDDKAKIWKYTEQYFFNPNPSKSAHFHNVSCAYQFYGKDMWENDTLAKVVYHSVDALNEKYKKLSPGKNYYDNPSFSNACKDFYSIFVRADANVVFEMITIYSNIVTFYAVDEVHKNADETEEEFEQRKEKIKWLRFDKFAKRLSEVFAEFGLNYKLTRAGIVNADEPKVIEEIYRPALKKLSAQKWQPVDRDLKDAFKAIRDTDGSGAITHALSALQALLQIVVNGKTGKGDTAALLKTAIKEKKIPDDNFSQKIISDLNAFWARERKKGDPHPKAQYATKQQAKLVINLVMVFIDHVL